MKFLDVISRSLLIGIGIAFLWVFSCILKYGNHYVREPSLPILITEIVGISLIVIIAIVSLFRDMIK